MDSSQPGSRQHDGDRPRSTPLDMKAVVDAFAASLDEI